MKKLAVVARYISRKYAFGMDRSSRELAQIISFYKPIKIKYFTKYLDYPGFENSKYIKKKPFKYEELIYDLEKQLNEYKPNLIIFEPWLWEEYHEIKINSPKFVFTVYDIFRNRSKLLNNLTGIITQAFHIFEKIPNIPIYYIPKPIITNLYLVNKSKHSKIRLSTTNCSYHKGGDIINKICHKIKNNPILQCQYIVNSWGRPINPNTNPLNPRKFYKNTDILLMPTRLECMPRSLFEAAINGIPTISSDIPCFQEYYRFNPALFNLLTVRGHKFKTWRDERYKEYEINTNINLYIQKINYVVKHLPQIKSAVKKCAIKQILYSYYIINQFATDYL